MAASFPISGSVKLEAPRSASLSLSLGAQIIVPALVLTALSLIQGACGG